jgi:hypothetical protein
MKFEIKAANWVIPAHSSETNRQEGKKFCVISPRRSSVLIQDAATGLYPEKTQSNQRLYNYY